ncbi:MAG: 5-formaminoimidazole-4-carboxamide-1-(beta)-D-ribofuranosyl 5'-monophosphate synthetase [Thermoplasmata archaeon]|nr:MAG: 5-formaminoimidazole-4-carboxamide-1-(beta)-D-ribofuranosyl 5'-monophosphate synthetase [Thermoplasmata archaeon]
MITQEEISEIFREYDKKNITIACVGSHSALQILKGAKDEGFKTLVLCTRGREEVYRRFKVADYVVTLNNFREICDEEILATLRRKNSIVIPHGSLIAYVGIEAIEEELLVPLFGNRKILRWEADRKLERKWLTKAGLKMPEEFKDPKKINKLCIVKFPGALGGKGYFLARNYSELKNKLEEITKKGEISKKDIENMTIQEYITGVNMYLSYFYSPIDNTTEFFSIDRRYEANIDGLSRLPAKEQAKIKADPSYVVVGNIPVVVRESLLPEILRMGDRVVEISKELCPPGMIGPFCLETMVTDDLKFITFEISARIVAGTNPFIQGSPYSYVLYGKEMSMGRRIAIEIKKAMMDGKEDKIIS